MPDDNPKANGARPGGRDIDALAVEELSGASDASSGEAASTTAPAGELAEAPGHARAEAQRERDELYDRLLRTTAEFDNFRKRVERERRDLIEYAAFDLLQELLPVLDDFERALTVDPASGDPDAYRKGVELIHKQFLDLLRKRGVTTIDAVGADFDPHVHQAVVHETSPEHREGEVIAVLRQGYKLGDRLLRPAMVKVAKA